MINSCHMPPGYNSGDLLIDLGRKLAANGKFLTSYGPRAFDVRNVRVVQ